MPSDDSAPGSAPEWLSVPPEYSNAHMDRQLEDHVYAACPPTESACQRPPHFEIVSPT
jgi:hypothetical protein